MSPPPVPLKLSEPAIPPLVVPSGLDINEPSVTDEPPDVDIQENNLAVPRQSTRDRRPQLYFMMTSCKNENTNKAKTKPRHYVCGCSLPRRLADWAGGLASLLVRRPCYGLFSLFIIEQHLINVFIYLIVVSNVSELRRDLLTTLALLRLELHNS